MTSSGTSDKSGISSGISSSISSNSGSTVYLVRLLGVMWLGHVGQAVGVDCWYRCGCGVWAASLGILWMQRYSLLSGTGPSFHTGSSRSAVGRGSLSSSESVSGIGIGNSSKVRYWWTPSQNGRLLGCLGVKGEIGHWAVMKSARSKEASVVNMECAQIGLVIQGGSPLSLLLSYLSSW